jgi:DNA ligase (NAD+)
LLGIDGVGVVVAESIMAWLSDEDNIRLLAQLQRLGVSPQHLDLSAGRLAGQSFVITGTLSGMSRDAAAEKSVRANAPPPTNSARKSLTRKSFWA